ncbi:hypothetical protein [Paracoccus sp. (in: a-proteobacteria)]|uniref:hypothetical protein n=1 Tax=Paracoccus sp. TaxID=267 RepID=UPI003342B208
MSPTHFKVRNWEQFQHYKDRNPPWIKLHFALLASEDWVTLDDASKLLAVVCMLIASRNQGLVPNNPAYLKRVAYLDKLPKLKPLIDSGFLQIPQADASAMQAQDSAAQADARPETETDTEKKEIMSERGSDDQSKSRSTNSYPEAFEAFWRGYPRTPNMSKPKALAEWKRLSPADRKACHDAVPAYRQFLSSKPDHPTMHAVTFVKERRFEGFSEQSSPAAPRSLTDDDWQKRLTFGRNNRQWHVENWGPVPGNPECRVPAHLLQPADGQGWAEWEA